MERHNHSNQKSVQQEIVLKEGLWCILDRHVSLWLSDSKRLRTDIIFAGRFTVSAKNYVQLWDSLGSLFNMRNVTLF